MSQATSINVIEVGPASASTFAADINESIDAIISQHSGASRPDYAVAGTMWAKDNTTNYEFYLYTGSEDILVGTMDISTGTWTPAGIKHNETDDIQGGIEDERYHLTLAQHTDLTDGGVATSHTHNRNINRIINGSFRVAQRGTSFTAATTPTNDDDSYLLDKWILLSDGNDIVDVTQNSAAAPDAASLCCALDVETANKKFGIMQIIENKDCDGLIGETVTLSFKAKVSATTKLDNIKAAIISWSGTADSITSDIVSAWGNEGTAPTLIANATYENTPANLGVTTDWATYSLSAAIDTSGAKNIFVFIWSDVTDTTAGDFLYLTDVQLEKGAVATEFEHRPFALEERLCQHRFYTISHTGAGAPLMTNGAYANATTFYFPISIPKMSGQPAVSIAGGGFTLVHNPWGFSYSTITSMGGNFDRVYGTFTGSGATAGYASGVAFNGATTVSFSTEL